MRTRTKQMQLDEVPAALIATETIRVWLSCNMNLFGLISVFVFLPSTYEQELRVEPNQNSVVLPPRNELPTEVYLSCRLRVTPPGQRLFVEWVVQNAETAAHFFVRFGVLINGYSMLLIGDDMYLHIENLSYKRAGNYTCRARLTADVLSPFQFATIPLSLKHKLETSPAMVLVSNETRRIQMRCEMSQYIEPDNNLRWFKDGLEISSDGQKYEVQFVDGDPGEGVVNGRAVPSRVSVLVVLNFELESDTGCYYCKTIGSSQRSESVAVSTEPDPYLCEELPTTGSSSSVAESAHGSTPSPSLTYSSTARISATPSPTPVFPNTNTDPTTSPGVNGGGFEEENQQSSPLGDEAFAIVIPASSVGLVLLFSVVLLAMICCLRCRRNKLRDAGNTGGGYPDAGVSTINVRSDDFSPPLPSGPRPKLHRVSQNSDYYMNEGEDPEKPYQSIPPYLSMGSLSAQQHLQLPQVKNNYMNPGGQVYDTVSDEEKVSKATMPETEYIFVPSGSDENHDGVNYEYVEMASGTDEAQDHKYMNTGIQVSDLAEEKMSNNEYSPRTTPGPNSVPNNATTGSESSAGYHRLQPDSPSLPSENQDSTYDKLSSQ